MSALTKEDHTILTTMATQVAEIHQKLPDILQTMSRLDEQQREHERRIIRLEGLTPDPQAPALPPLRLAPADPVPG